MASRGLMACFLLGLVAGNQGVYARPSRFDSIDRACAGIKQEFVEAEPDYFAGPAPWVEMDTPPTVFKGGVLALVYREGSRVRWVVLEMTDKENTWFERVDYFFGAEGEIEKRERILDHTGANVRIEESIYFRKGKRVKDISHHSSLNRQSGGKKNWDLFGDPDAPEYTSTADLPVLFQEPQVTLLGDGERGWVYVPAVLKPLQRGANPC